jgi:hypothetical protein
MAGKKLLVGGRECHMQLGLKSGIRVRCLMLEVCACLTRNMPESAKAPLFMMIHSSHRVLATGHSS